MMPRIIAEVGLRTAVVGRLAIATPCKVTLADDASLRCRPSHNWQGVGTDPLLQQPTG